MKWRCEWGMVCDRGVRRAENQDAALVWTSGHSIYLPNPEQSQTNTGDSFVIFDHIPGEVCRPSLFALVADGMGGGPAGATASRLIIETAITTAEKEKISDSKKFFRVLIDACDKTIFQNALTNNLAGMGSTCTALVLTKIQSHLCHIGDSRCYRISASASKLRQWTSDHNLAAQLVRDGAIAAGEAATHPSSRILTQAVGLGKSLAPQVEGSPVADSGEAFLICSDGLIRTLEDREILAAITPYLGAGSTNQIKGSEAGDKNQMQLAAEQLLALATERGAPDNVTVILINLTRSMK